MTPVTEIKHRQKNTEPLGGLTRHDFRKIAPNGFGDPYNEYPHSMLWFQDSLYVGTSRANLHYRGRWRAEQNSEGLGAIWPVKIPEGGLFDIDLRAQIWRCNPLAGNWSKVYTSPLVEGISEPEVPLSIGFRCMTAFQGTSDIAPALYVPTWGSHQTPEAVMLRSEDGVNFECVSEPGLGFPDPFKPRAVRGFASFRNLLFAAPAMGAKRAEPNTSGFGVILVTDDPVSCRWQLACEPGFGNPNNLTAFHLAVFNDHLYAATANFNEGFQIWKTDADGDPPYRWRKVISHGAFRGKLNQVAIRMVTFKDCLYVGSAIAEGGWDLNNKVGPAAPEMIRLHPDDSWDLIMGDPRLTPDGFKVPVSGLGAGFGNPFAGYLWSLREHNGWLYAGDSDWSLFLKYARRERIPEKFRRLLNPQTVERLLHRFGGCDLWRSRDGLRWIPITRSGFDNCFNMGVRNMVSTQYGLFVGLANPYSPEVAVKRISGWNYEDNPEGGLEIWLGAHRSKRGEDSDIYHLSSTGASERELISSGIKGHAVQPVEEIIERFFGGSGFRHFGFWQAGIENAQGACENLMDEIMAFMPEKKGTVVDIDCGRGATTACLLKHFPADAVVGISADRKHLKLCRQHHPGLKFLYRKLPKLKLASDSVDFVVWVKGIDAFGRRLRLLQNSYDLLRPGGRLICLDILYDPSTSQQIRKLLGRYKSPIRTLDDYQALLTKTGFHDCRIVDVTSQCYDGFKKYVLRYFGMKQLADEIDEHTYQNVTDRLLLHGAPVRQCLLITGCRPK